MARKLFYFVCVVMYVVSAMTASAAPLPNGTVLKITPGIGSDINTPCILGSCIGWQQFPGFYVWHDISPGTDGGFIVGKSQASGGQENVGGTAPGELTAAGTIFPFASGNATLYTQPDGGTANMFDNASCTKAACIGKTALNTLNIAWNGSSIPIGSAAGCPQVNCTADQQAGIFVNNYIIDLVGNSWAMDYAQVVPTGAFANLPARIIFRGRVIRPNCPVVGYAWVSPTERSILVFGSNLLGATGVKLDGANVLFQRLGNDILWLLPLDAVTWPWKPGTIEVINANAGCSGYYPTN